MSPPNDRDELPRSSPGVPSVAPAPEARTLPPLDEVMLAMDMVDSIRHEQDLIARELDADSRDEAFAQRLRQIYASQGIEVTDGAIAAGIDALKKERFSYRPPERTFAVRLAEIYIDRRKWSRVALVAAILGAGLYFAVSIPKRRALAREVSSLLEWSRYTSNSIESTQRLVAEASNSLHGGQDGLEPEIRAAIEQERAEARSKLSLATSLLLEARKRPVINLRDEDAVDGHPSKWSEERTSADDQVKAARKHAADADGHKDRALEIERSAREAGEMKRLLETDPGLLAEASLLTPAVADVMSLLRQRDVERARPKLSALRRSLETHRQQAKEERTGLLARARHLGDRRVSISGVLEALARQHAEGSKTTPESVRSFVQKIRGEIETGILRAREDLAIVSATVMGLPKTLEEIPPAPALIATKIAEAEDAVSRVNSLVLQVTEKATEARRLVTLAEETPRLSSQSKAVPADQAARQALDDAERATLGAVTAGDISLAQTALERWRETLARVELAYELRIISRPGEPSAVWRHPNRDRSARNHYVLVEAIGAGGKRLELSITSEENQSTRTVSKFGVRVPEATYEAIRKDKSDNGIVDRARLGRKERGKLDPAYDYQVFGGYILEW